MASTSSPTTPSWKHDVFLSFRGTDTRYSFTSHLYDALQRNQIYAYIDNKLDGGEKIEPALLEKIEDSYISVVIFSENYADSTFCLRELSKIHECMETKGQMVLPVFHQLDPSQVQNLTGSYGEALSRHERECASEEVESWRHALKEIANLKGWDSRGIKDEARLIKEIVSDIQNKLHHALSPSIDAQGLVGMQSRVQHIESLLSFGSTGVLIVGIWGMGGIGKSTTAEAVYNRNFQKFEGRCFFRDVREESKKNGVDHVRQEILGKVLEKKDLNIRTKVLPPDIKRMLQRKKVLIVLDDVNDSQDLKFLVGEDDLFGQGSRIIVTSRDKQVLINACQENRIYKVNELDEDDALRLFSFHAFKQNNPPHGYTTLSKDVVSCAKGIPLVLEVLGAILYKKSDVYWKSMVEQLRTNGGEDIKKRLETCYHELDLDRLSTRGLPITRQKFNIVEVSGRVFDEDTGEELDRLGRLAPTVEKAKRGFGMNEMEPLERVSFHERPSFNQADEPRGDPSQPPNDQLCSPSVNNDVTVNDAQQREPMFTGEYEWANDFIGGGIEVGHYTPETIPIIEQANPETEFARDHCSPEELPHDEFQTLSRTEPVVQVLEQSKAERDNLSVDAGRTQVGFQGMEQGEEEGRVCSQFDMENTGEGSVQHVDRIVPPTIDENYNRREATEILVQPAVCASAFVFYGDINAISTSQQEQNNEVDNVAGDAGATPAAATRDHTPGRFFKEFSRWLKEEDEDEEPGEDEELLGPGRKRMAQLKSGWTLLLTSLFLEIASAVFDQLGYAFVGMVLAFVALLLATADLIHMARKERMSLLPICHRTSTATFVPGKPGGTIVEYFGLVGAVWQCVYSTVAYAYARQKKDNPIKMSLLPLIFFSCVVISKLNEQSSLTRVLRKGIFLTPKKPLYFC